MKLVTPFFSRSSLFVHATALFVACLAAIGCSGSPSSTSPDGGPKEINCCIIETLIQACPSVYGSAAASLAYSGNDQACKSWLDNTPEGADGHNCVNGYGTPIETVEEAAATCGK